MNPGESCVITVVTLLGEIPYPAIGTAETELAILAVPSSVFLEIVLGSPAFRVFVFNPLSQRIAQLLALVDNVAFRRVDQRLASRLLLQREPDATTHQMLADELGTSREVVSRILETFQHARNDPARSKADRNPGSERTRPAPPGRSFSVTTVTDSECRPQL